MLSQNQIRTIRRNDRKGNAHLPVIFEALGEWGRFRIFKLLAAYKDLCVTDVANILGITVPAASQQLKRLERSELIRRQRNGQMICYELNRANPNIRSIISMVTKD
ncbi:winged helix-turn-helix transcriptional regulator [Candidatus Berkelbacteria bacterium]|nr:winged helix-turn-helix transcriptional regulator [Candidatus Berkelbacteria bacterium]